MKGNKKILVIAILLLLIAVSYGTYAIYKSSLSGSANVTAALWKIEFKDGSDTLQEDFALEFDASDCTGNTHVADGKIAPGATCTKEIVIDATDTEVDVSYTVEVDDTTITFKSGNTTETPTGTYNAFTGAAGIDANVSTKDGLIEMDDTPQADTVPITITWAGQEGENYDAGDTEIGEGEWTIVVPVTVTAKQVVSGS